MEELKRKELERFKADRSRELDEKKKLEELRRRRNDRSSATSVSINVNNYVDDVLNALIAKDNTHIESKKSPSRSASERRLVRNVVDFTIQPKSNENYDKSIQAEEEEDINDDGIIASSLVQGQGSLNAVSQDLKASNETNGDLHVGVGPADSTDDEAVTDQTTKQLAPEERNEILKSNDFKSFFSRTSRVIERMLCGNDSNFDVAADYLGLNSITNNDLSKASELTAVTEIRDQQYTLGRPIHDIKASPHFPELFVVAYGAKQNSLMTEPAGIVALWSLSMPHAPERIFTAPSPVLAITFCKFNPSIFLGTTYNGSVCLWDTKTDRATPIQISPLTSKSHCHPTYACSLVGSQNAHNLLTVSTDGRLCSWTVNMLAAPTDSLDVKRGTAEVSVLCASLAENETNSVVLGVDDGSLVVTHVHGVMKGVDSSDVSHKGPVTALDFFKPSNRIAPANDQHPLVSPGLINACTDLLLSSSVDWSVKLWTGRGSQAPLALHSFDCFDDYVTDVKFHPFNPAVFATIDCSGQLALFNLARELDSPVASVVINTSREDGGAVVCHALNKLTWLGDGKRLVVGDSAGVLRTFRVDREIWTPSGEDQQRFSENLTELRATVENQGEGANSAGSFSGANLITTN